MGSLDFLASRSYAAEPTVGRVVDDTPVALRITHPGTEAVTSVTVNTASNIVLIDADATTTIDITAGATNTIGEVCDYINSLDNWSCKVLDALRADTVATSQLVDGAITSSVVDGERVWDAKQDTSILKAISYRVTYDRNVGLNRPKGSHRVKLTKFTYNADVSAAEAGAVRIYKWDAVNKTENQVWQATSVDGAGSGANDTSHTFTEGLSAGENNDLIVRIMDTTSVTDNAANFLQCEYTRE